jgi:membrane protein YqaA with SNARE-associated domain
LKLFSLLYDRVLTWARHPHAERYLVALSFAESSFFPIPPDVMLAPMTLATPNRGWRLALATTIASVLGGVLGYAIGWFAFDAVEPWLRELGYWDAYRHSVEWFEKWGFFAVLIAGFSPIPYKVFTIAAGALNFFLPLFVVASFIGRGSRFFLVAALLIWGGAPMERRLKQHIDKLGWATVAAVALAYLVYRWQ